MTWVWTCNECDWTEPSEEASLWPARIHAEATGHKIGGHEQEDPWEGPAALIAMGAFIGGFVLIGLGQGLFGLGLWAATTIGFAVLGRKRK